MILKFKTFKSRARIFDKKKNSRAGFIWRGWVHLTFYTRRTFHWPSFMHLSWSYKQDLIPAICSLLQNIFPPWHANFACFHLSVRNMAPHTGKWCNANWSWHRHRHPSFVVFNIFLGRQNSCIGCNSHHCYFHSSSFSLTLHLQAISYCFVNKSVNMLSNYSLKLLVAKTLYVIRADAKLYSTKKYTWMKYQNFTESLKLAFWSIIDHGLWTWSNALSLWEVGNNRIDQ